jgi:hypothetical protein|tara:strand:- start:6392 stop:6622 length:231 start_codon:yes stop_codon:yes gene_type:complete
MKYRYKVKEIKPIDGTNVFNTDEWTVVPDTYQEIPEMSLHKLIKKLDKDKMFFIDYVNKKSNDCNKIVYKGDYKIV